MAESVPEPAKVFEDRLSPGDWRVEWEDDDGGVEVTTFSGPSARERPIQYADRHYRHFVDRGGETLLWSSRDTRQHRRGRGAPYHMVPSLWSPRRAGSSGNG